MENNFGHQLDHIFRQMIAQQESREGIVYPLDEQLVFQQLKEILTSQKGIDLINSVIFNQTTTRATAKAHIYSSDFPKSEDQIFFKRLYSKLEDKFKFNWDFNEFSAIFLGNGTFSGKRLQWPRGREEFSWFIGTLKKKNKIIQKNYWSYMCNSFYLKKENYTEVKYFKSRPLSVQFRNCQFNNYFENNYFKKTFDKILSDIEKE